MFDVNGGEEGGEGGRGAQNREGGELRRESKGEERRMGDVDSEDYSCDENGDVVERTETRDK